MIADRRADELKLAGVKFDARLAEHLAEEEAADEMADGQAVRLGDFVNMIGGDQAAGAGHVLDHDTRVAGDVLAHMA